MKTITIPIYCTNDLKPYPNMAINVEEQYVESLSSNCHNFKVKNFVWTEQEWPNISYDDFTDGDDAIPIVSLRPKRDGDAYETACKEMVSASEKWGFFNVVNHGVNIEIIEDLKIRVNELFELDMEQKLKGARSSALPLGYSATNPEYGTNLPWAEILQLLQSPKQVVDFGTKVFGDQHQPFRYLNALDKLGMTMLEMLARGLGLEDDFFTRNMQEKDSTMLRINRYPPCPLPEKCLGLGSHSDPHTLTILLQDDQVSGLQILNNDNKWVGIRPIPNSFVINIGDTLQAWTNGRLRSVVHRAVVNKEKSRLSAAYFLSPSLSTLIDSPPQLVDPNTNPRKYMPFTWGHFRTQLVTQKRVVASTALNRYLI